MKNFRLAMNGFMLWKMAFAKCCLLCILGMMGAFNGSKLTTELWNHMGWVEKTMVWTGILSPAIAVIVGFLDTTISEVKNKLAKDGQSGLTEFIEK
jgi:hypothetical protein